MHLRLFHFRYSVGSRKLYPDLYFGGWLQILFLNLLLIGVGVAVGVIQHSDTLLDTSQEDFRSAPTYFSFLMSCAVMALARMRQ